MASYTAKKARKAPTAFTLHTHYDAKSGYKPGRVRSSTVFNSGPLDDIGSKVLNSAAAVPFPVAKQPEEVAYILVMGRSGAGKTSFINLASGSRLPVSSGLKSCTASVSLSEPFRLNGRKVVLIDTPGFDDSSKSDADVLNIIAEFLSKEFKGGRKLHGILYFHRISDVRMGALSKKNFVMFQKLCGQHAYPNVVLVTSRWSEVNPLVGASRENELRSKAIFFKPILDAGASLMRYDRTIESAHSILLPLLCRTPVALSIQRQMVEEKKNIASTEAGLELRSEKLAVIKKHEESLKGLAQEIEVLKEENDVEGQKELEADVEELKKKVVYLQEENKKLLSRQNSWELFPEAKDVPLPDVEKTGASAQVSLPPPPSPQPQVAAILPAPASAAASEDEEPRMIGGLPLEMLEPERLPSAPRPSPAPAFESFPRTESASESAERDISLNNERLIRQIRASLESSGHPDASTLEFPSNPGPSRSWGNWLFSFHPSVYAVVSGLFYGMIGGVN